MVLLLPYVSGLAFKVISARDTQGKAPYHLTPFKCLLWATLVAHIPMTFVEMLQSHVRSFVHLALDIPLSPKHLFLHLYEQVVMARCVKWGVHLRVVTMWQSLF